MTYKPQLGREDSDSDDPARVDVWTEDLLAADGLRQALAGQLRVECVDALADAEVVLWDASSLPIDAPSVLAQLKAAQANDQSVVALVGDAGAAAACAQLGVRGALLRRIHAPSLRSAILAARAGLCVYDAAFAESWLAASNALPSPPLSSEAAFTTREQEVLQLLALGLSNRHIAKRLAVSIHTVKFHVNSILAKLNVSTRTAAVSTAIRAGLIVL